VLGDADGSGKVDIVDAIVLNKAILGKETLTENGLKAIDFNGNGKPDAEEAQTLLKYIVGLITDFTE
ncbi:MAG: dockerin type I repeat-containing protein, partial [Oscillospiraceae bacterium]|nr:dockerin type I repeat-containing protein [Oscillospiraceae bacterium]